ncbi:MAG: hypothetical protein HKN88_00500 [Gammaproteobacteria bacterium]|nr:hypothetical protein [Gammaproteobacteria bacterium]
MRIVIFINRSQQDITDELRNTLLQACLKRSSVNAVEHAAFWPNLLNLLDWDLVSDPREFHVVPVRVEVGMRDSICYPLPAQDSVISADQLVAFNQFFENDFVLHKNNKNAYILKFIKPYRFNLAPRYWPPYFADYRVQVQAASGELKKHLSEMQAWCYQQNSVWNALYLWPLLENKTARIIDYTRDKHFSDLNYIHDENASDRVYLLEEPQAFDSVYADLKTNVKNIDAIHIRFADSKIYELKPNKLLAWWQRFFDKS